MYHTSFLLYVAAYTFQIARQILANNGECIALPLGAKVSKLAPICWLISAAGCPSINLATASPDPIASFQPLDPGPQDKYTLLLADSFPRSKMPSLTRGL
jgi:hypothetical protein